MPAAYLRQMRDAELIGQCDANLNGWLTLSFPCQSAFRSAYGDIEYVQFGLTRWEGD